MTDYEREAREAFVEWTRDRPEIRRIAIVIRKPVWRMVISAMSIASSRTMRAFDDVASARAWLAEKS